MHHDAIDRILKSNDLNIGLSDTEIIYEVEHYMPSQSCSGAALGYLQIVTHICYFKEHLQKPLLKIAIRPIIYLGINDYKKVMKYITEDYLRRRCTHQQPNMVVNG